MLVLKGQGIPLVRMKFISIQVFRGYSVISFLLGKKIPACMRKYAITLTVTPANLCGLVLFLHC